jgi:hypothetical protein
MNGYEIMRRNIEFDNPDRIGMRFNSFGVSDVYRIFVQPAAAFRVTLTRRPRSKKNTKSRPAPTMSGAAPGMCCRGRGPTLGRWSNTR